MRIWAKTAGPVREGKYLVVRRDGTIPEWPHFVLGGFDPCASVALEAYAAEAERRGFGADYVGSIRELAGDFRSLSETERARKVADPTAGPHRKDDPQIVSLMAGRQSEAVALLRLERAGQRPDEAVRPPTSPSDSAEGEGSAVADRALPDGRPEAQRKSEGGEA